MDGWMDGWMVEGEGKGDGDGQIDRTCAWFKYNIFRKKTNLHLVSKVKEGILKPKILQSLWFLIAFMLFLEASEIF